MKVATKSNVCIQTIGENLLPVHSKNYVKIMQLKMIALCGNNSPIEWGNGKEK